MIKTILKNNLIKTHLPLIFFKYDLAEFLIEKDLFHLYVHNMYITKKNFELINVYLLYTVFRATYSELLRKVT